MVWIIVLVVVLFPVGVALNAWRAMKLLDKGSKSIDKSKLKDWSKDGWDDDDKWPGDD